MAHDQEQIIIAPAEWCQEAAELLAAAVPYCAIEDIRAQVESGAALFRLTQGGALVGYYVLRVDHLAEHSEGVIVAGAGTHPDVDLTALTVPVIERQFFGCKYVRIHTARPGLVRKLAAQGYQPQEFVMRKPL